MPDYQLLSGLAEGLQRGLMSYDEAEKKRGEREEKDKDRKLKQELADLELAEKGYARDPATGKIAMTEAGAEKERTKRVNDEVESFQKLSTGYGASVGRGFRSPEIEGLLHASAKRIGNRYGVGNDTNTAPSSGPNQGSLIPASATMQPGLMQQPSAGEFFQKDPSFKTPEERQIEGEVRRAQLAKEGLIEGETRRAKIAKEADIEKEALRLKHETAKEERDKTFKASPEGRLEKLGTEGKQKLGFITSALQNLTDYEKVFKSGERQSYLSPDTPGIGGLVSATPIDVSRTAMEEAIGRLASGGAINAGEEQRFRRMIPKAADTDAAAKLKLGKLRREFENKLKGYGLDVHELPKIGFELGSLGYVSNPGIPDEEWKALSEEGKAALANHLSGQQRAQ